MLLPRRWLSIICISLTLLGGLVGCAKKPAAHTPSEAETFAMSVLNARFVERDGRWLALETTKGTTGRLIELNKPTLQFNAGRVTDTDQMNGITQRCTLSVFCEQFRYWDGTWTEWKSGTGGSKQGLVNAMTNGMLGYQHYQLEKKNGEWVIKGAKPPALSTDRTQLQKFVTKALDPGK